MSERFCTNDSTLPKVAGTVYASIGFPVTILKATAAAYLGMKSLRTAFQGLAARSLVKINRSSSNLYKMMAILKGSSD